VHWPDCRVKSDALRPVAVITIVKACMLTHFSSDVSHLGCCVRASRVWKVVSSLGMSAMTEEVGIPCTGRFFCFCLIHTALTAKYITAPRALPSPGYPKRIWHIGAHQGDKPFPPRPIKRSTPPPPHNKVVKPSTKENSLAPSQHRTTLPSPPHHFGHYLYEWTPISSGHHRSWVQCLFPSQWHTI
jgi:hypothetical protein